ncbi:MAG: ATP-grasp domain-containing protein [Anaerolineae bacterium]|nr:ATP-grasp domain-containing protein [Anaerolineae bacterium]
MNLVLIKSYTDKPWRSPETYQLIEDSLQEKWEVTSITPSTGESLHNFLEQQRQQNDEPIFVFNVAEYLDEENKVGFLPDLLDAWQVPHLGSSAETVAIGLDKAKTKVLLDANQIPTPGYFVAHDDRVDLENHTENLAYPLIVKPLQEGGHIGISEESIVYDADELRAAINHVVENYEQPALVEEYITGEGMREFSVGVIGNGTKILTPIEIDYASMDIEEKILSYEAAQKDLEKIKLVEDEAMREEINGLAARTFAAVGASDYSRIDLRMNHTGCYVLEINIMPGLGPHSFLPDAANQIHDLEYNELIQSLAENSMRRQFLSG